MWVINVSVKKKGEWKKQIIKHGKFKNARMIYMYMWGRNVKV